MSTRGWYEYYVVDESRQEVSLAMQYYKWGDATPHNALAEVRDLLALTDKLGRELPVELVREMLQDNLGEVFHDLPPAFPHMRASH